MRSEHGELTGVAKMDATVRRGAVSVPHGHAGANVNLLTSKDDVDVVDGDDPPFGRAREPAPRLSAESS